MLFCTLRPGPRDVDEVGCSLSLLADPSASLKTGTMQWHPGNCSPGKVLFGVRWAAEQTRLLQAFEGARSGLRGMGIHHKQSKDLLQTTCIHAMLRGSSSAAVPSTDSSKMVACLMLWKRKPQVLAVCLHLQRASCMELSWFQFAT